MADEATPIRAAVTQMQKRIRDLEMSIEALESRLQWVLSPELSLKLEKPENSVTTDSDRLEAMRVQYPATLLNELAGCINKLEKMK
ncbi:MAG: hypothetical protein ACTSPB_17995, partial [Candidatus Thorarchaeota archaeon]